MDNRKLSEEAGLDPDVYTWNQIQLKRFAELVRQDERELCAKVIEQYTGAWDDQGYALAHLIRARGDNHD